MNLTRNVVFDFGDRVLKSYADFGLIQKSAPEVTPPAPKTNYVEVPGANGSIDLSEALTGYVVYEDREIVLHFRRVMPEMNGTSDKRTDEYLHFAACLQGRRCKLYLDESDKYCFDCRLTVGEMSASGDAWDVDVTAVAQPYRTTAEPTVKTIALSNTDLLDYDLQISSETPKGERTVYALADPDLSKYYALRFVGVEISSGQFKILITNSDRAQVFTFYAEDGPEFFIGISELTTVDAAAVTSIEIETSKFEPTEISGQKPGRAERITNGQSSTATPTACTRPTVPTFSCANDGATISVVESSRPSLVIGASIHVAAGETKSSDDIVLRDMLDLMIVPDTFPNGNGVVKITYQEGVL